MNGNKNNYGERISIIREIKMKRNYYEILGVKRNCTGEDVFFCL